MKKSTRNKIITVLCVVLAVGALVGAKAHTAWIARAVQFSNPPATGRVLPMDFYKNQLDAAELALYDTLVQHAERFEGGALALAQPLTVEQVNRVVSAFVYECPNYFYAAPMFFLDEENRIITTGVMNKETPDPNVRIQTVLFQLSCAAFREKDMQLSGTQVTNLAACDALLRQNDAAAVEECRRKLAETQQLLAQVVQNAPKGAGQRELLEYLCDWIFTHVTYDTESLTTLQTEELKSEMLFDAFYTPSSTVCALQGKGMCVGFAKLLTQLCSACGIEAHAIISSIPGQDSGHAITAVRIDGVTGYLDLSGMWTSFGDLKKVHTEQAMQRILKPIPLFEYHFAAQATA